ncbi:gluconokinase [Yoonia litorea]|nr:gluconokinase [Yoonia litorea]
MNCAYMVMGVSGCGKSTVGAAFADRIGAVFLDGDDYHPQQNVDHMAAGHALTDEMRWPWLDRLAAEVIVRQRDETVVFACSALKRSYRMHLRDRIPRLEVVYLEADRDLIAKRLGARHDHFMPASLLDSQFATLEAPETCFARIDIGQPVTKIIDQLERLV